MLTIKINHEDIKLTGVTEACLHSTKNRQWTRSPEVIIRANMKNVIA